MTFQSTFAVLALVSGPLSATVLFSDSFDRANGLINNSNSGINNNTGSDLSGGAWTTPFVDPDDPVNPPPGDAGDGGGARIQGNQLQLAVGSGTSNAYINHNFTNPEILSAGGFSVTIDLTGINQSGAGQGGGFAIGMTLADANASGDALSGSSKFQDAFHGNPANQSTDISISSFFLVLRGNGRLVWGGAGNFVTNNTNQAGLGLVELPGFPNTGTISATFTNFDDFNAGTSFDYEVFYNGISQGSGTLTWQNTDANYIGLDARDNTAVSFDNLLIETIPEPSSIVLGTLVTLGFLRRRR